MEGNIQSIMKELAEDIPQVSPDIFAKIEQGIAASDKQTPLHCNDTSPLSALFHSIQNYVNRPRLAWGVAIAQTIAICLLINFPINKEHYQTLSAPQEVPVATATYLYVIFQPDARADEIQTLLSDMNVSISNGPSKQHIYTLKVRKNLDTEKVIQELQNSPAIAFLETAY